MLHNPWSIYLIIVSNFAYKTILKIKNSFAKFKVAISCIFARPDAKHTVNIWRKQDGYQSHFVRVIYRLVHPALG